MQRILLISGGAEAVPGIERVRALGLRVAVADADEDAPGMALADDRVVCSTYDAEGMIQAARELREDEHGLDGVLSIAADVPVTVAKTARALGLPRVPVDAAEICADKLAMKARLSACGVPVPWCAPIGSARELAVAREDLGGTLILKPVDSRGARGVLRVTRDVDCEWAFERAREASPTGRAMVEAYLEGPQLSTESILVRGRATTLGCSDRNYARLDELAPFVIEDGGVQPSRYHAEVRSAVDALIERCAAALGILDGTLKGDLVLTDSGPAVIEVAPRLSGGWFATDQIPYSTGVDLVQLAARIAVRDTPELDECAPRRFDPVAVRYCFPEPGIVRAIEGLEEVAAESWCLRATAFASVGDELGPPTDHTRRAGLVIATGGSREEAVARAEEGAARIRFATEPSDSDVVGG